MIKKNMYEKKSEVTSLQALVTILLAVIILLLSAEVLNSNSEQLVSTAQDAACRTFLEGYDSLLGRGEATRERFSAESSFFGEITKFCRTERLIFESREEEDVFNRYAQASRRCYERYGSGDLNFLDFTQRSGSYCFVCAEVEFENVEDSENQVYLYRDLGKWMEEEIPQRNNKNRESFRELLNLLYIQLLSEKVEGGEGISIQQADDMIQNNQEDYNDEQALISKSLDEQYLYLRSMYYRELPIQEKSYIVYKYENKDSYAPLTTSVATGAVAGASAAVAKKVGYKKAASFVLKKATCYGTAGVVGATGFITLGAGFAAGGAIAATCTAISVGTTVATAAVIYDLYEDSSSLALKAQTLASVFAYPGIESEGNLNEEDIKLLEDIQSLIEKVENSQEPQLLADDLPVIPKSVIDGLSNEQEDDYESIVNGNPLRDEEKIKKLISGLLIVQSQKMMDGVETPDFTQYVEILPQGEFYNQCGPIPNQEQ